jgi:hypothetical protein
MVKKIKSFTVDGDAYDSLVRIFKESRADVSVSLFVNNCIKELSVILADIGEQLASPSNFSVPMSFVIKSMVESNDILGIDRTTPKEYKDSASAIMLLGLQEEYEMRQGWIPAQFVPLIKSGEYFLCRDRRYVIEKETGIRYMSGGKGSLIAVDNPETELKATKKPVGKKK